MFVYDKVVVLNDRLYNFKYKVVTGELSCSIGDSCLFKQFLWLPFKRFYLKVEGKEYELKTILFPINKVSLTEINSGRVVCHDLFPRLRRYTLISFLLSSIKKVGIMLALVFS